MLLKNRLEAGILLADKLLAYRTPPVLILGLVRGGVVTAKGISGVMGIGFDILVVKKLSSTLDLEFAFGAVAPDHVSLIHWKDAHRMGADEEYIKKAVSGLSSDVKRMMATYRSDKKPVTIADKTVIIVDDGAATGTTMEAAILWARKKRAKKIIAVLPVAPIAVVAKLRPEVDACIVLHEMKEFRSVGSCYEEFGQVTDDEVIQLLKGDTV